MISIILLFANIIHAQTNDPVYTFNGINIDSIDVHIVQLHTTITMNKYGFIMGLKFGTNSTSASGNYHWKKRDQQVLKVDGEIIDMENNNPAYILNILYECGFKLVGQSSNQITSSSARTWIYYTLAKP